MQIGIDIIEVERVRTALTRSGERLTERVLTPAEQEYVGDVLDNSMRFAGIWAAKEAAVKALGTGFRQGITFHDIQIDHDSLGMPYYCFSGEFQKLIKLRNLDKSSLSISHTQSHAVAVAVLIG
ncbi:holo-ACP synthase [Edaphovirga cremea]|uniref:holo-ACP synthase n=1 Tax=Edaphovirga cremea TaxID=2267246 RepID=UPI000DEED1E5|nr:holo-ACP synthase [Edaphovirga cremea]